MLITALQITDDDAWQGVLPFQPHEMVGKYDDAVDQHIVTVRHNFASSFPRPVRRPTSA